MSSTFPDSGYADGRTLIIAHRGASGYLPEHTAVAKAYAYALGVDFIEQDVVATRDRELVVLHDTYLDAVSDVAERFAGRQREDGYHYAADFTLAELRELSLHERRRDRSDELQFPGRFPYQQTGFSIQTFDEEIRLISGLNASTGGHVGLYPEIKDPGAHEQAGIDLTRLVYEALERARPMISGPVFIQSFSGAALRNLRDLPGMSWPLVQLIDAEQAEALAGGAAPASEAAAWADAIGVPYTALIAVEEGRPRETPLVQRCRDAGLRIHAYTLRRDVAPPGGLDYFETLRFLINDLKVGGLFCDHPDDAIAVRDGSSA